MVGALAIVLPLTALSLSPGVALLAAAAFVAGIGFDVFGVAWETALQQHIPIERLSRVSSYDMLGSFVAMPVGQVLAGPLTAVFEVRDVVLAAAGVYAVVALVTLAMPAVWNLRAEQSVPRLGASA
jgi:MFS family permease